MPSSLSDIAWMACKGICKIVFDDFIEEDQVSATGQERVVTTLDQAVDPLSQ